MSVPYKLAPQIGAKARLGFIILSEDETIEDEWRVKERDLSHGQTCGASDVATFTTRISSSAEINTATLAAMEQLIPATARTLPGSVAFDVVGYACTSASCVIGPDRVADLVKQGCNTTHVTNPISALISACHDQNIERLALLSPYTADVNETMRAVLNDAGIATPVFGSFNEPIETHVARIDPASLFSAACEFGADEAVDAVFLSCTNLRTATVLDAIAQHIGKPAMSSNSALFAQMCRLAGL